MLHNEPRRQQDLTDERLLRILAPEPSCGHRVVKRLLAEQPAPPAHAARSTYLGLEARGQNRRPHLTVLVDRRVPVSPDELRRASMDVNRILGAIGVTTDWEFEQSSEHSARLAGGAPTGFVVHVVIVARLSGPSLAEALPLGLTPPGPHFGGADVVVFHDHVQDFAQVRHKPAASVLALVITHEIGHALLPAPAHSSVGIMQAEWDQQTMDQADDHELRFTTQQGALIRDRVNHCCGLTAGR